MNKTLHKPSLTGLLAIALLSGVLLVPTQVDARDNDRGGGGRDNDNNRSYSSNSSSKSSYSGRSSTSDRYAQYQREQQAKAQRERAVAAQRAAAARKSAPVVASVSTGPVADVVAAAPAAATAAPAPAPTRSQPTLIKGVSKSSVYEPKGFAPQTTELLYALAIASSATGLAVIATDLRRRYSADQIIGRRVTAMR